MPGTLAPSSWHALLFRLHKVQRLSLVDHRRKSRCLQRRILRDVQSPSLQTVEQFLFTNQNGFVSIRFTLLTIEWTFDSFFLVNSGVGEGFRPAVGLEDGDGEGDGAWISCTG